mgnify:CR=1 FL=1
MLIFQKAIKPDKNNSFGVCGGSVPILCLVRGKLASRSSSNPVTLFFSCVLVAVQISIEEQLISLIPGRTVSGRDFHTEFSCLIW